MDDKTVIVSDLVKDFPGVRAIDHLSFDVAPGEIFGLVGPDGGKRFVNACQCPRRPFSFARRRLSYT